MGAFSKQQGALSVGVIGTMMVLASMLWPDRDPRNYWSDEQEAEYATAFERVRTLAHDNSHRTDPDKERDLRTALLELDQHKSLLNDARQRSSQTSRWLLVGGAAIGLIGFGLWQFFRSRDNDN